MMAALAKQKKSILELMPFFSQYPGLEYNTCKIYKIAIFILKSYIISLETVPLI